MFAAASDNGFGPPPPKGGAGYYDSLDLFRVRAGAEPEELEQDSLLHTLNRLAERMDGLVREAVAVSSRDEFLAYWGARWDDFMRCMDAYKTLRGLFEEERGSFQPRSIEEQVGPAIDDVRRVLGGEAADEFLFTMRTCDRVYRAAARFASMPLETAAEQRLDRALGARVRASSRWYIVALKCLLEVVGGTPARKPVVDTIFQVLRFGATHAYHYAAEAQRLRAAEASVEPPAEFDTDDLALADEYFDDAAELIRQFEQNG